METVPVLKNLESKLLFNPFKEILNTKQDNSGFDNNHNLYDPSFQDAVKTSFDAIEFVSKIPLKFINNKVFVVSNLDDYLKCFKLRAEVYGEELKYDSEFKGALNSFEYDKYDKQSIHLMSLNNENELIATSRLILDRGYNLPTSEKVNLSDVGSQNSRGEISRAIIRSDYRKNPKLLFYHAKALYNIGKQIGVTDLIMSVIDSHVGMYHPRLGGTSLLAESQNYGGMKIPVTSIYWNLNFANPKLFEVAA